MQNKWKKLLATALALVMLIGLAPAITPQARAEVYSDEIWGFYDFQAGDIITVGAWNEFDEDVSLSVTNHSHYGQVYTGNYENIGGMDHSFKFVTGEYNGVTTVAIQYDDNEADVRLPYVNGRIANSWYVDGVSIDEVEIDEEYTEEYFHLYLTGCNTFPVSVSGGANANVSGSLSQTVRDGQPIETVTYTPKAGYYFADYEGETVNGVTAALNNGVITVSGSLTGEVAIQIPDAVPVPVTGVTLDKDTATLAVNETVELKAIVAPDNAADKSVTWTSSDETVATVDDNGVVTAVAIGTATITAATTDGGYTAACTVTVNEPTVTVTFDTDGGSAVAAQTVTVGNAATRPADPTKEGYIFVGWQLEGADYDFTAPVTGDITLTAQWELKTSTITVNEPANGTITSTGSAAAGEAVTLTVTPDTGFELDILTVTDANGGEVEVTDNSFTMPAGDVTVTATFCEKPTYWSWAKKGDTFIVTVTFVSGTETARVEKTENGDTVTYTASVERGGKTFTYEKTYKVGYTLNVTDGEIVKPKESYSYGESVTVTAEETNSEGKYFSGWYRGETKVSDKLRYTFSIIEDTELTARYEGTAEITAAPILNMTMTDRADVGSNKERVTFVVEWSVPSGYTFVSAGIVRNYNTSDNLTVDTASKVNKTTLTTANGSFKYNLTMSATTKTQDLYAKGYLTYNDEYGEAVTVYTDLFTSVYNQLDQ